MVVMLIFLLASDFKQIWKSRLAIPLPAIPSFVVLALFGLLPLNIERAGLISLPILLAIALFIHSRKMKGSIHALVAFSALLNSILCLLEFHANSIGTYGIPQLLPSFYGFKPYPTTSNLGSYAQTNLTACFLGIGIFSYLSLISRYNYEDSPWSYIPIYSMALALFLTGSRSGFLGITFCTIFYLWAIIRGQESLSKKHVMLFLFCLATAFACSLALSDINAVTRLSASGTETAPIGVYGRLLFWLAAWKIFLSSPITGVGFGKFHIPFSQIVSNLSETSSLGLDKVRVTLWAHNDFLQILAEGGIFVLVAFLFIFFFAIWLCVKTNTVHSLCTAACILFFGFIMNFSHPIYVPGLAFIFILLLIEALSFSDKPISLPRGLGAIIIFFTALLSAPQIIRHETNMIEARQIILDTQHKIKHHQIAQIDSRELASPGKDPVHGWFYQNSTLRYLSDYAFWNQDSTLADLLLPMANSYQMKSQDFSSYYFHAALYYTLMDYEKAYASALRSNELKPDPVASNLAHLSNVMLASKRHKRPVKSLLGPESWNYFYTNGFFSKTRVTNEGIAK